MKQIFSNLGPLVNDPICDISVDPNSLTIKNILIIISSNKFIWWKKLYIKWILDILNWYLLYYQVLENKLIHYK